jgi:hypothetical protein
MEVVVMGVLLVGMIRAAAARAPAAPT